MTAPAYTGRVHHWARLRAANGAIARISRVTSDPETPPAWVVECPDPVEAVPHYRIALSWRHAMELAAEALVATSAVGLTGRAW
jgi:hypothetical protein